MNGKRTKSQRRKDFAERQKCKTVEEEEKMKKKIIVEEKMKDDDIKKIIVEEKRKECCNCQNLFCEECLTKYDLKGLFRSFKRKYPSSDRARYKMITGRYPNCI